jgi:CRP/FNR family cyclic AMP-dependent transcriptional regulator
VPVLSGLEGRSLESVIEGLNSHVFPVGTTLFYEGELGRTMYILESGEVEIRRRASSGRQVPIVRLGAGECFGEMAMVELQPRSASVVATRRAICYSINSLELYKLFHRDAYAFTIVLQNICRLLSRRLRKADGRIGEFLDTTGRKGPKRSRRGR